MAKRIQKEKQNMFAIIPTRPITQHTNSEEYIIIETMRVYNMCTAERK